MKKEKTKKVEVGLENDYLITPDDKEDIPWFLIYGGITKAIMEETFESFRAKLWELLLALTSKSEIGDEKKRYLSRVLDSVSSIITGSHYFLHQKRRLKFEAKLIDVRWVKNPYRSLRKYRCMHDTKISHHLAHFEERFTELTRKESQNFVLVFERFFLQMDLYAWLRLIQDWEACVQRGRTFYDSGDCTPLRTYEQILKLHEAYVLSYRWAELTYPAPTRHLIQDFLGTYYEGYRSSNPIELISFVFGGLRYKELQKGIVELYRGCSHEREGFEVSIELLRSGIKSLLEAGWLLLQTDYYPEDWLDPNSFDSINCPIGQKKVKSWFPNTLCIRERHNIRKTLTVIYSRIDVREEIEHVNRDLTRYLENKSSECSSDYNVSTRSRLLKILDVLAFIVVGFCNKRTKGGGVNYPNELAREDMTIAVSCEATSSISENS